jgi:hypothetical protein
MATAKAIEIEATCIWGDMQPPMRERGVWTEFSRTLFCAVLVNVSSYSQYCEAQEKATLIIARCEDKGRKCPSTCQLRFLAETSWVDALLAIKNIQLKKAAEE